MRLRRARSSWHILGVLAAVLLISAGNAFAQGSIFGSVTNSDASVPLNGQISFFGYLDDTDEEIRIETSTGAGYDNGNWFDDFQNYLTEAPGNPYDYHFYNLANGEGFHLAKLIPNNSFQQEDIVLAPVTWPAQPAGLTGTALSAGAVLLEWNGVPGLTYHVYRRHASSNGSFFRLDDPAGSLANPGVADSFFVDATVDGVSSYHYLIIAEDAAGNLSPHSAVVTVNSATVVAPVVTALSPASGTEFGGTVVTVTGSNFDPAGATVTIGLQSVAATVISPYELTFTTPPGTPGAVDVSVTNTASGLASNTLVGGFTYTANAAPVLAPIGPQSVTEGLTLAFTTSATDADGGIPVMTSSPLPGTATYVDNGDGTGSFSWATSFTDAGVYTVTFYAIDNLDTLLVDSEVVTITVNEAGNQPPVLDSIPDTTVAEGGVLTFVVTASDPDAEIPALSVAGLPLNATFVDNLDGTGTFTFSPDFTQAGIYSLTFYATDAAAAVDSQVVTITVTQVNQPPVLAPIGPQTTTENVLLSFVVTASDGDGDIPVLRVANLPAGAVFTDSLNGNGLFEWLPGFTDAGVYAVTFYAVDALDSLLVDSEVVTITVNDAGNQAPVLDSIPDTTIFEGDSLTLLVTASDPDGDSLIFSAAGIPVNATFVDNFNGTATFTFVPDFTQAGTYPITFYVNDGLLFDSQLVTITVTDAGNVPPQIVPIADTSIGEGGTLVITVTASDPDGPPPALSVTTSLQNYTFVDNGDGTGVLTYTPDFFDAGTDTAIFFAVDNGTPPRTATEQVIITTLEVNQPPVIDSLGPFSVEIGSRLSFTVVASDSTDPDTTHQLILSALNLPLNATFVDNGDGTGLFDFTPDSTQAGVDTVTFLAVDQGVPQLSTTRDVIITVVSVNQPPILDPIGPQAVMEGATLNLVITASDPDGGGVPPSLEAANLPQNATFTDLGSGTGAFSFSPNFVQAGLYSVVFKASDGIDVVKENVLIQVYEAGDQAPVFSVIPSDSVIEGNTLVSIIQAYDPDTLPVALSVDPATVPPNMTFVDSGNGTGVFTFAPDYTQSGVYVVNVTADDGTLQTTVGVTFVVIEAGNQTPVLDTIPDQFTTELIPLTFTVRATDPDADIPILSMVSFSPSIPATVFVDNGNGTGTFDWTPDDLSAGVHQVRFYAEDGAVPGVFDSLDVTITVADTNRLPLIFTSGSASVFEGDSLFYSVVAVDPDSTIPFLGARLDGADTLATNMTMVDNRDGTGVLIYRPGYDVVTSATGSVFLFVRFYAIDEMDSTLVVDATSPVQIEVKARNKPPQVVFISGPGPYSVIEGDTLLISVGAQDDDAQLPPTIDVVNPPANSTFSSSVSIGTFTFVPDFTQAGTYLVSFVATDDQGATDTGTVQITVVDAGNQAPYWATLLPDTINVVAGTRADVLVQAVDPDLDALVLTASPVDPVFEGGFFFDSGNGNGVYTYMPPLGSEGTIALVTFIATDGVLADTMAAYFQSVAFLRGDVDGNHRYTINDLTMLISYLYRQGPSPGSIEQADVDNSGTINVADITYLINFLYYNGPPPPQ